MDQDMIIDKLNRETLNLCIKTMLEQTQNAINDFEKEEFDKFSSSELINAAMNMDVLLESIMRENQNG